MKSPEEFGIEEEKLKSVVSKRKEKLTFSDEIAEPQKEISDQTLRGKLKIDKLTSFFKGKVKEKDQFGLTATQREVFTPATIEKTEAIPLPSARSTVHVARAIDEARVTQTAINKGTFKILLISAAAVFAIVIAIFVMMFLMKDKTQIEEFKPAEQEIITEIAAVKQTPAQEQSDASQQESFIDGFSPSPSMR